MKAFIISELFKSFDIYIILESDDYQNYFIQTALAWQCSTQVQHCITDSNCKLLMGGGGGGGGGWRGWGENCPQNWYWKWLLTNLPAKSTRFAMELLAISCPASLIVFCVNVMLMMVWARLLVAFIWVAATVRLRTPSSIRASISA